MRASFRSVLMDCGKIALAIFVMAFMVIFAKVAQYSSVDQLGDEIGFGPASLLALVPILTSYFLLAQRLPPVTIFGRTYG